MKRALGLISLALLIFVRAATTSFAQSEEKGAKSAEQAAAAKQPPKEESVVTEHTTHIGGATVPYQATAGTILLKNEKGEPTASIFYMAYTRSDMKDLSQRPLTFAYNGGPGSSSVWLHMGALGPKRVVTTDAESTPPPPYKVVENQYSILDKTDLVMIDPVGTGFSHAVGEAKDKDFWGVDQDAESLGQFVRSYVSKNGRWNSPKYLLGESYGTTRSSVLANYLQQREGIQLNGVVLVSMVLDFGTISFGSGNDEPYILYLPSYTATACYHKVLKDCPVDLNGFLNEARRFAATEYADALRKGAKLTAAEKSEMAKKMSRYTGLSEDYLIKANLRANLSQFREELQRSKELTTGRLDARFTGPAPDLLAEFASYDPQSTAVTGAFTSAFNEYVREELKFGRDLNYHILAEGAGREWDWKRTTEGRAVGWPGNVYVAGDLAQAMRANPRLRVEVENGIYDLATPFFATEYTMDHLGLPENLQKNIQLQYYDAGHMMYLHQEALAKLKANIAKFIETASHP